MLNYSQFTVSDVSREPIEMEPANTVHDARNTLLRYNISRVVVAKDKRPLGIVTEKDISRLLYNEVKHRRLKEIRLDEAMTKNPITVNREMNLKFCSNLMLENKISSLIVIDNNGQLNGVVTKSDLVEVYAIHSARGKLVEKYMTKRVLTIAPDETIHMALLLMVDNKISRVVVARNRKPVGIITGRDLLPISSLFGTGIYGNYRNRQEVPIALSEKQEFIPSGIKAIFLASDIMKYDPITIAGGSDLVEAALIMGRNRISGIPVVDSHDNLVGIITKTDIIKALASDN
jgi:CBS domain-containing protein